MANHYHNLNPEKALIWREGLRHWRGGPDAAARKDRLFDDRALGIALERLRQPATVLA